MRNVAVAVCAALIFKVTLVSASHTPFPDTEGTWWRYIDAIQALQERGIIDGYPDGTFKPKDAINRAELLKIVFKGHSVSAAQRRCFSDINPDEWYAPHVCTAKRRGIIDGYPDGTYKPGRTINFAEAIKIILGAYGREIDDGAGETWYAPYVEYLDSNDIFPAHSYVPWNELTRVRAADLLWRIVQYDEESIVPRFSSGCGKAAPSTADQQAYLLTVPSGYVTHDPTPLVIAFHGRTNSNEQVRSYYRFDREMTNMIIAYPAGDQDVALFDTIVEEIASRYCIDMDRIFVAGHSLGGWMANAVACERGDVVRASASVGSSGVAGDCTGPSAAMIIHHPDDRLAPFAGSVRVRELRSEQNGCNWDTVSVPPEALECVAHSACAENSIHFCPHTNDMSHDGEYYPHNWPRSASKGIAEFFRAL